ncbi:MAG TPA: family 20 glycosylhydrolase [Candidatus Acidoferrales bacterium]|nr:family 20 glycosylhydrolase [Candidatus Acidoferrales bacterium]
MKSGVRGLVVWVFAVSGIFVAAGVANAKQSQQAAQNPEQTPSQAQGQPPQNAGTTVAAQLNLVPQPREVKLNSGEPFRLTRKTKIIVAKKFGRDFAGAQMLADEIARWTGSKLKIDDAERMPGGSDFIYIGDAMDDARLRDALGTSGLAMQSGFDPQGYAILAERQRILVAGASEQGAFYGVQTLRQLLRPAAAHANQLECPVVAIRDWPAMKWRGASIDISRGPIPTLEFMEKQIRTLAAYKLNLYGLYMEDVFTVKGNGIFAPPNALTPDEITQLVAYANKYHVTILPELETFGHLHNVLRYDAYSDLAETPHGSVLTPTLPGSYDLIGKLISEMAPLFPGPFFHIGADETNELGQGKTKDLIAQQGLGQVYLAHIAKLDGMLKPFHKQTMFWADIAEKFPQLLPTLPKDLIAVVWTYGVQPDYNADLDPFKNAGLPIFVSPGIGNWRKVYPDFNSGFMNIRNLTRDGQKYGAIGQLNTEWKDRGEELGGMDWPGLIFGAACGWQAGESSVEQFMDSYDWAFYRNTDHTFEDALNKLAGTNTLLHGVKLDGTHVDYFWASPFSKLGAEQAEKAAPVVHELRVDAEQAWESLLDNRAKARMNADTLDDLIFAAQRVDLLGLKFEYTQEMSALYWNAYLDMANTRQVENDLIGISSTNGRLEDLRERLAEVRDLYAARFRAQNREAWLGNVLVRYDELSSVIQQKINQIDALETEFRQEKVLPPPENMGFYYRPTPIPPQ